MMRNRYPGNCYRCGMEVPAGAGNFEMSIGKWRVQHADCAIRWRGPRYHELNAFELHLVKAYRSATPETKWQMLRDALKVEPWAELVPLTATTDGTAYVNERGPIQPTHTDKEG